MKIRRKLKFTFFIPFVQFKWKTFAYMITWNMENIFAQIKNNIRNVITSLIESCSAFDSGAKLWKSVNAFSYRRYGAQRKKEIQIDCKIKFNEQWYTSVFSSLALPWANAYIRARSFSAFCAKLGSFFFKEWITNGTENFYKIDFTFSGFANKGKKKCEIKWIYSENFTFQIAFNGLPQFKNHFDIGSRAVIVRLKIWNE